MALRALLHVIGRRARNGWRYVSRAATAWSDDNAPTHSSSLAYYTVFSIAPLLVICIALAGTLFGDEASSGAVYGMLRGLLGDNGARGIQAAVRSASSQPNAGVLSTVLGVVTLVVGASAVFSQLQTSLNAIWHVRAKPGRGLTVFLRQRLLSFSMVLAIGFILLVSLVLSAGLSAVGRFLGGALPGGETFWHFANFALSFAVITLLFASIFKILPDVDLAWRDVWAGSALTAFLFAVGKLLIGLYLGHSSVASAYGAAGSLVIVLLWVYYSSLILYFGAELTRVYSMRGGAPPRLKRDAEWAPDTADLLAHAP